MVEITYYQTETFNTVPELQARIEEIDCTVPIRVVPLPYWRRNSPQSRSIEYQYMLVIGCASGMP